MLTKGAFYFVCFSMDTSTPVEIFIKDCSLRFGLDFLPRVTKRIRQMPLSLCPPNFVNFAISPLLHSILHNKTARLALLLPTKSG